MEKKNIYLFISDDSSMYYSAKQSFDGGYTISTSRQPVPLKSTPGNLLSTEIEFATNQAYFSLVRSISYALEFNKDGAAILRQLYYLGKMTEQRAFLTIIEWNGSTGLYEQSYFGRFDFSEKDEDPKSGVFKVPTVDDSAWGVLSTNDETEYAFDCSRNNPNAVEVLLDGINLVDRYTFQTVQAPIYPIDNEKTVHYIPFALVNQDGDSSGILAQSQTAYDFIVASVELPISTNYMFRTFFDLKQVRISGSIEFEWTPPNFATSYGVRARQIISFNSSYGQSINIFDSLTQPLILGKIYTVPFDFTWDLIAGESIFFLCSINNLVASHGIPSFQIVPIVTNTVVEVTTRQQPQIVYGLRAGDLLEEVVNKATYGRYNINSNFFAENNKDIV